MSQTSTVMHRFGGLRLDLDPMEVGGEQAVELLDVELDAGTVRARSGWIPASTAAAALGTTERGGMDVVQQTERRWIVTSGDHVLLIDANRGAAWTSGANCVQVKFSAYVEGTGMRDAIYVSHDEGLYQIDDWSMNITEVGWAGNTVIDGGTGYPPSARALAVTPTSNRLAFGGIVRQPRTTLEGVSFPSRVYFSDPIGSGGWRTTNWVDVAPGSGGWIKAIAGWNESLYVFKEDRYAVFYGEQPDATGLPVFSYRMVERGVGARSHRSVAAAPEGIYTQSTDGHIYLVAGSEVQRVSDPIAPLLGLGALDAGKWPQPYLHAVPGATLTWADGRLAVLAKFTDTSTMPSRSRCLLLLRDSSTGEWVVHSTEADGLGRGIGERSGQLVGATVGRDTASIGYYQAGNWGPLRELDGSSVPGGRWVSGRYGLGAGEAEVAGNSLWLSGSAEEDVEFWGGSELDAEEPRQRGMGSGAGGLERQLLNRSRRGRMLWHAVEMRGTSAARVHAVEHLVRGGRPPEVAGR